MWLSLRYRRIESKKRQPILDLGPKPNYVGDSFYLFLLEKYKAPFLSAQTIEKQIEDLTKGILDSSSVIPILEFLFYAFFLVVAVVFFIDLYFLITFKGNTRIFFVFIFAIYFGARALTLFFQNKYFNFQEKLLEKNISKFAPLNLQLIETKKQLEFATQKILFEWDRHCVSWQGYPPDWNERKQTVKQRDRHLCTFCGWPTGYRVLRRNLHVHHIVNLSKGGDNSLNNLTTLCHICHRNQDGPGHQLITYIRKRRKKW